MHRAGRKTMVLLLTSKLDRHLVPVLVCGHWSDAVTERCYQPREAVTLSKHRNKAVYIYIRNSYII